MKKIGYIVAGLFVGVLLTYIIMNQLESRSTTNNSSVIAYEVNKLNKMIVAEQTVSNVVAHKSSRYIPGFEDILSLDKKLLLIVNAKVQATYDLKQLEVEIDSTNKTIIINRIPELELVTYPDVRFYNIEQNAFMTFDAEEINAVQKEAVATLEEKIDRPKLKREAHEQLIENLGDLYLLAKAYNWKIKDNTPYAKELQVKYK